MSGTRTAVLRRELLVRCLDGWLPGALHRSRRMTVAQAYAAGDAESGATAEASLAAVGEFADRLRGRRLTMAVLAGGAGLAERLDAAQRQLGTPAELSVHVLDAGPDRLPAVLTAAGAPGAPVFGYLDLSTGTIPAPATLTALAAGRPADLLLVLGAEARAADGPRLALARAGFTLVTEVELVPDGGEDAELVAFATSSGRSLDSFKDALWAVDEFAGVRYRDPYDPDGHLLDISLEPHPGPLRRELLATLGGNGPSPVAELRRFAAERTVYRASDANRVLTALLAAGTVRREPGHGRLSGDVVIALAPTAPA